MKSSNLSLGNLTLLKNLKIKTNRLSGYFLSIVKFVFVLDEFLGGTGDSPCTDVENPG